MKKIFIPIALICIFLTSCTTTSRAPSSKGEFERIEKEIRRLDHQMQRTNAI
ncbi:hypothetical protein [Halobacteriovorax marinus]|uniref:hypothetical protein n=1 Tax=Halobacteriovorax marinus TaxID=97084 RepID=UPI003A91F095